MNKEQTIFLELLKSAIWHRPANISMFTGIDSCIWEKVFRLSTLQRTTALIADGIQTLPDFCLPPNELYLKLFIQSEEIEKANLRINKALSEITAEYAAVNCPFILLKGQGLALNYPNPLHRTPGDLDLFLYQEGDYEKAKEWVKVQGYPQEAECLIHLGYTRKGIHIENHKFISVIEHPRYYKLLKKEVKKILATENLNLLKIGETEVKLLPPSFDALFVFIHMLHHFMHLGVGIRQFCDWVLLLNKHKDFINKVYFESLLEEFALQKPACVFANAAIKYLDAPRSIFPFELHSDDVYSDVVMEDILDAGHFGFYRSGEKRPKGKWSGRWFSFRYTCKRSALMHPIAPEHIFIVPFVQILTRLKLTIKGDL